MFDDVLKQLNKLKSVSIPVESDEKGYLDKQCPAEDCEFLFKVKAEDWSRIAQADVVWCPMCRHEAPAKHWHSIAQVEHAKEQALALFKGEIHNALVTGAEKFNSRQTRNSFITMSMKVQGGKVHTTVVPAKAAEEMRMEVQCEVCNTRFSVIGNAFFCPACGHDSVTRNYADALKKIQVKRDNLGVIRQALTESTGKDEAEVTCRSLLESCVLDGVVAFQKFCEELYIDYGKPPFNAFQRLEQGGELWQKAIGAGYGDWLTPDELKGLKVLYQKRHILAHNDGIVDDQYISKSADNAYKVGQRIVVSERDIGELLGYLEKLGTGLETACRKG